MTETSDPPNFADFQIALARDLIDLGLSNKQGKSAEPEGTWLLLMTGSAGQSVTWTAPRDLHIRNVLGADAVSQWTLGFDGRNRTTLLTTGAAGRQEMGSLIAWYSQADPSCRLMNVAIPAGTKITLTTTAASAVPCLVYLTD